MAALTNFPAGSVTTTGYIAPTALADVYPTHDSTFGRGGLRSVETIPDRDAITLERQELGMEVYIISTDELYRLQDLGGGPEWVEVVIAKNEKGGIIWESLIDYIEGDMVWYPPAENAFVCLHDHTSAGTLTADFSNWTPLSPDKGGTSWIHTSTYHSGDIVTVGNDMYISQTHNTNTPPATNPSDWLSVTSTKGGAWESTVTYASGDIVTINDDLYVAIISSVAEHPTLTPTTWTLVDKVAMERGGVAWVSGTEYFVGDMVYESTTQALYWCTGAHISNAFATEIIHWDTILAPPNRNKGWFDPNKAGGGHNPPVHVINNSVAYENGDYMIATASGTYDFTTGYSSATGLEVKSSDRIAYNSVTWFVLEISLGLMQGWFDPDEIGGGPSLKENVSNACTTYVIGEYVIAVKTGRYDLVLGQPGTAAGSIINVGTILRWDGLAWQQMAAPNNQPIHTLQDVFPLTPKIGDVNTTIGTNRPYIFNGNDWASSTHMYMLESGDDWNTVIKLPKAGDQFTIMESDHTIIEGGYSGTQWHLRNGKKRFKLDLDSVNAIDDCRMLIKNISPDGNSVYDVKVIDQSPAGNGSYHAFTIQIKDGEDPIAVMSEENTDNAIISDIGVGVAGDSTIYVSVRLPLSNQAGSFLIDVESDTYGDTNAINVGTGTAADNLCPILQIAPPATGGGTGGSLDYVETELTVSGYDYIKERKYTDGRLEYIMQTARKKIDNYNNLVGYARYNTINFTTPFVGDYPFPYITADCWGDAGLVWGSVYLLTLAQFTPMIIGNDKDYSEGHLFCKLEGRWEL